MAHPEPIADRPDARLKGAGLMLLAGGLAINTWTLGLLADDGEVSGPSTTLGVAVVQWLLIALGVWALARSARRPVRALLPVFVGVALVATFLNVWGPVRVWRDLSVQRSLLASIERSEDLIQWLTLRMSRLTDGALNLHIPDARSGSMFADELLVTDIVDLPQGVGDHPLPGGLGERHDWTLASEARRAARDDTTIWAPLFDSVDHLVHAKFKIVRGDFAGDEQFDTDMAFEAVARLRSGRVAQLHGELHVSWRDHTEPGAEDAVWLIHEWHTGHLEQITTERSLFDDVLANALPDPDTLARARASLHEQLVLETILDEDHPRPEWFTREASDRHPGVSVVDIDRDGFDDIYIMARWGRNLLLHNQGDGTFEDIAPAVGLDIEDHTAAAIFADFDNDGDTDAFLGRTLAPSQYLVNEGGRFVDRSEDALGPIAPHLVSSVAAADYDSDGLLDLYVSTYSARMHMPIIERLRRAGEGGSTLPFLSQVDAEGLLERALEQDMHSFRDAPGPPNLLLRNTGAGFEVAPCNADTQVWRHTFQSTFADYDGDGDPDIYTANDFAPNNLLRNEGGRFVDVTEETRSADIGFGMGATWGDYDDDGDQDLYVTNMFSKAGRRITAKIAELDPRLTQLARGNSLLDNTGTVFETVSGMEEPALLVEKVGWSWGAQFVDIDNDGSLDLYAPTGYYTAPDEVQIPVDL